MWSGPRPVPQDNAAAGSIAFPRLKIFFPLHVNDEDFTFLVVLCCSLPVVGVASLPGSLTEDSPAKRNLLVIGRTDPPENSFSLISCESFPAQSLPAFLHTCEDAFLFLSPTDRVFSFFFDPAAVVLSPWCTHSFLTLRAIPFCLEPGWLSAFFFN